MRAVPLATAAPSSRDDCLAAAKVRGLSRNPVASFENAFNDPRGVLHGIDMQAPCGAAAGPDPIGP